MENKPTHLLKIGTVLERTGLGRSSLYRMVGEGLFPVPIKLGPRAVAWVEAEVEEWILHRIEASRCVPVCEPSPTDELVGFLDKLAASNNYDKYRYNSVLAVIERMDQLEISLEEIEDRIRKNSENSEE